MGAAVPSHGCGIRPIRPWDSNLRVEFNRATAEIGVTLVPLVESHLRQDAPHAYAPVSTTVPPLDRDPCLGRMDAALLLRKAATRGVDRSHGGRPHDRRRQLSSLTRISALRLLCDRELRGLCGGNSGVCFTSIRCDRPSTRGPLALRWRRPLRRRGRLSRPVSYTHLTLPHNRERLFSVACSSLNK